MFYPERGQSSRAAKAIFAECCVKADCLAYALENNEQFGIWGGTSERDRRVLARRRAANVQHA
jgi:WhiB family redox-sensing transcriptional regulator